MMNKKKGRPKWSMIKYYKGRSYKWEKKRESSKIEKNCIQILVQEENNV
jgi:hypothetical protein